ncbi:MAG: aldehyde ferredoxin oxidoreductase family protein [Nitrososphaeria archaeon]|nr:aldehyde ferredoxin oxidoreductase family protein [Nitrososphaeria archaeon]
MYCYAGKFLKVDLSNEKFEEFSPPARDLDLFIGGSGIAAKIIFDMVHPGVDPLSPENVLVFATGPLTGTIVPTSARFTVAAKSPLTKGWGEAHAGGFWGVELKKAGYDGLILVGRASSPVYLVVRDDSIELRDASKLWGLDTYEVDQAIKRELKDSRVKVATIGPAGEKLVNLACIAFDIRPDGPRIAGRTGMGAVMGSKNLKAIAVSGSGKIEVADPQKLRDYIRRILPSIMSFPTTQIYSVYGTSGEMGPMYMYGDVPIKNFSLGKWDGIEKLRGEVLAKTLVKGHRACFNCPIGCWRYVKFEKDSKVIEGRLLEYEAIASLGSLLLIDDPSAVLELNDLCNRLGVDVISTGVTIAWLLETHENNLLEKGLLEGLELRWGDPTIVAKLIEKLAKREDIGELLSMGVREASKRVPGSEPFAMHVKGLEIPMHDPRAFKGMGLQYATSNRGADHLYGLVFRIEQGERNVDLGIHERIYRFAWQGKGRIVALMEDWSEIIESMGICKFLAITPGHLAATYSIASGKSERVRDLLLKGTRIFTLKRLFNLACGLGSEEDKLPPRFLKEPLESGGCAGQVVELEEMLKEYYEFRGWSQNGLPTKELLDKLGLLDMISNSQYLAYRELALKLPA